MRNEKKGGKFYETDPTTRPSIDAELDLNGWAVERVRSLNVTNDQNEREDGGPRRQKTKKKGGNFYQTNPTTRPSIDTELDVSGWADERVRSSRAGAIKTSK